MYGGRQGQILRRKQRQRPRRRSRDSRLHGGTEADRDGETERHSEVEKQKTDGTETDGHIYRNRDLKGDRGRGTALGVRQTYYR